MSDFKARYILIYPLPNDLRIVGPFETEEKLVEWGVAWQSQNNDDPRWQQVELPHDDGASFNVEIVPPTNVQ